MNPIALRPKIVFDTSGINELENGGSTSEPLMRGLTCGFEVIVTAMSVDELISTPTPEKRRGLLSRLGRLLASGMCIWPPHLVTELMIATHARAPAEFDWKEVDVRARVYEDEVCHQNVPEELCVEQRTWQLNVDKDFRKPWKGLRPILDNILAKDESVRPSSYHEAVTIAVRDGGTMWSFGQALYEKVSRKRPSEAEIRSFIDVCPPFRAACHALVMAWHNWSLRRPDGTPAAGRNDLMMAVYLPYCDRFITADWAQRNALSEIAEAAGIDCEIVGFEEFRQSFAMVAQN